MRLLVPLLAAFLAATSLLAQAAAPAQGAPWSEITGERQSRSTLNRAGTSIKMIDGYPVVERQPKLKPGPHVIVVQWVPRKGLRTSDRTLRLDTKPCKRYYVNAQFASPGSTLWQPIVDKVEDIPTCKLPVELPVPGAPPGRRG